MSAQVIHRFERPLLKRHGPNRGAANFYRSAADGPDAIGGVSLDSAEAAATAVIRLGYRIADAQVSRLGRIASRLREAGDQATGGAGDEARSDRQALDATEQLIFKSLLAGLSWLEGVAGDRRNPVRRLATSQFQLLGALLGLLPPELAEAAARATAQESSLRHDETRAPDVAAAPARPPEAAGGPALQIRHAPATGARLVRLVGWELALHASAGPFGLVFYGPDPGADSFEGDLAVGQRGATLTLRNLSTRASAGLYKAPVCDTDGTQLGFVELTL